MVLVDQKRCQGHLRRGAALDGHDMHAHAHGVGNLADGRQLFGLKGPSHDRFARLHKDEQLLIFAIRSPYAACGLEEDQGQHQHRTTDSRFGLGKVNHRLSSPGESPFDVGAHGVFKANGWLRGNHIGRRPAPLCHLPEGYCRTPSTLTVISTSSLRPLSMKSIPHWLRLMVKVVSNPRR